MICVLSASYSLNNKAPELLDASQQDRALTERYQPIHPVSPRMVDLLLRMHSGSTLVKGNVRRYDHIILGSNEPIEDTLDALLVFSDEVGYSKMLLGLYDGHA